MRLLLVEDNPLNVEVFVDGLEVVGHEVVVERDGVMGLKRALAEPFDLVLVDVRLPRLSGAELCRELRAAGVRAPIVALSSGAMAEDVARGFAAGFDGYLTKPISPHALREAVRRYTAAPRTTGSREQDRTA